MTKAYASVWDAIEKTADDAAHMQVRGALMVDLQKRMQATGDTQAKLAKSLGVTQPQISDVVCGRIDLLPVDMLIDLLAKLGVEDQMRKRALPSSKLHRKLR